MPFTHAYFYRTENPKAGKAQMSKRFASLSGQAWLEEKSPETVVLRVKSFRCTAEEMDSLMRIVMRKDYRNLIVDLRGNGGGSLEGGMTLARYLTAGETATGVYLTQKWFNWHPAPPTAVELASMPAFTKADVAAFTSTLDSAGYVVLKATPGPQQFTGKAFILTDRRTASACEPLTWNLKHYGRATVVGESTAGAMLSAESYPVKNGFTAVIPNGDYYTPEGNRLDRIGVAPHLAVNGEAALDRVMRLIEGK
ncbi:MAG: hypothetical protein IPK76_20725 [Lewinellaceae bacterium]|nr:hypothetical protein [Lewinellaceae bacterium]